MTTIVIDGDVAYKKMWQGSLEWAIKSSHYFLLFTCETQYKTMCFVTMNYLSHHFLPSLTWDKTRVCVK